MQNKITAMLMHSSHILPFSLSFNALYAFFNIGISSVEVFSAIQDTEDMKDAVESVGEGGPGDTCNEFLFKSKRPGGEANCDNIIIRTTTTKKGDIKKNKKIK
jgi:hypothetical protein